MYCKTTQPSSGSRRDRKSRSSENIFRSTGCSSTRHVEDAVIAVKRWLCLRKREVGRSKIAGHTRWLRGAPSGRPSSRELRDQSKGETAASRGGNEPPSLKHIPHDRFDLENRILRDVARGSRWCSALTCCRLVRITIRCNCDADY